jgi:hypothetical protein
LLGGKQFLKGRGLLRLQYHDVIDGGTSGGLWAIITIPQARPAQARRPIRASSLLNEKARGKEILIIIIVIEPPLSYISDIPLPHKNSKSISTRDYHSEHVRDARVVIKYLAHGLSCVELEGAGTRK